jgi:hypothetical protein
MEYICELLSPYGLVVMSRSVVEMRNVPIWANACGGMSAATASRPPAINPDNRIMNPSHRTS